MHAEEEIRIATLEDIPLIRTLFRGVFGSDRDDAVWQWKYFDRGHPGLSVVCRAGARVVAHCGGIPVTVRDSAGRTTRAMQSVDFMSSQTYPGGTGAGGVFVRTARRFFEEAAGRGVSLLYGFPGERHRQLGERLLGYTAVEKVGELTVSSTGSGRRVTLRPISRDDLPLLLSRSYSDRSHAVRSKEYLHWRYLRHPRRSYMLLETRNFFGLRPAGFAILTEDEDAFHVMEMNCNGSSATQQRFVSQLADLGKPVKGWCSPASRLAANLLEAGFSIAERDHFFEVLPLGDSQVPAAGEFDYSLGDYDVY